ncbi:MAG: GNAT family N-acetyltransferase [Lachnospira sp.]|nr:GNAT family N-acetyltransferase [Lachnospira sp.]
MAGKFLLKKFADIDLGDSFFDSLKADYPGNENSTGFIEWFNKKANNGSTALVFEDEVGVGAFVVLKDEYEEIILQEGRLPNIKRIKISTFRIAERFRRQRIGEGAIGLLLWKWQRSDSEEIYVTVFDKHKTLISQFERFGFKNVGKNPNGENVLIKSRKNIDFSDPYKAFPFIKSNFDYAGYVIVDDNYHDTMFAYSELANTTSLQSKISSSVSNGLSKIYVGKASEIKHKVGEPVLVYRKYTQGTGKKYKSCITSYCVVTDVIQAKANGRCLMSFETLKSRIGNKSVFHEAELLRQYDEFRNLTIIEMLYYGYFGAGNNVNLNWLDNNGCWITVEQYPTDIRLTEKQFRKILTEGNVDVSNVIID